ncbi:uncharacterized protein DUF4129 [Compostimonas suwonensis]|uniref:Uncharacterized protein DUF4129 n=1 Tax=Compostimonas suwonensis TaxID=1048394 RepID=A0A2M9BUR7_9MICO|nr:uncharacterized protein DUF4129 [Compostimonas suwonensis]
MIAPLLALSAALASARSEVPVDPDAPEARQWLLDELGKPQYQAARPNWFDELAQSIWEWFQSLTVPDGSAFGGLVPLIVIVLVAAAVVVAVLVFGLPRLNRRAPRSVPLFGAHDDRTAEQLRAAAQNAAAGGRWNDAVQDLFRALARSLVDRTVVLVTPGTTAHEFAVRAGAGFPDHAAELLAVSRIFDGVRYLGETATLERYESVRALDAALTASTPAGHESRATVSA